VTLGLLKVTDADALLTTVLVLHRVQPRQMHFYCSFSYRVFGCIKAEPGVCAPLRTSIPGHDHSIANENACDTEKTQEIHLISFERYRKQKGNNRKQDTHVTGAISPNISYECQVKSKRDDRAEQRQI
jgi:hypothetical protein